MAEETPVFIANDSEWELYKRKFSKTYRPEEEEAKRQEWENSIKKVNEHNLKFKSGVETWSMGINQFSDGTKPAMGCNMSQLELI